MLKKKQTEREICNVYRTKHYIVKQVLYLKVDTCETNAIVSRDTFYERTKQRDLKYESEFAYRRDIDGKRLHANMSARVYVK